MTADIRNICIDDTQGFDGVRFYDGYIPTLRSQRSGLKVFCESERLNDKYKQMFFLKM